MSAISVWGHALPNGCLTPESIAYLRSLPATLPEVEWVWQEMDKVWKQLGLDNRKPLEGQAIGDFYSHPVWLMNGIFTQLDLVSAQHRAALADYFNRLGLKDIADYGGGFGELGLAIVRAIPDAQVSIIEPYPSPMGIQRLTDESSIKLVPDLEVGGGYDAVVAQDVLEHVEDPIDLAFKIASAVHEGGYIVFANCFYPMIQCHLPRTFHLRHTFRWVMRAMGLRYLGVVPNVYHAQVFRRARAVDLHRARNAERISRLIGPLLNRLVVMLVNVKGLLTRK